MNASVDMPIVILRSLVICTVLYILFAYVLSGVTTMEDFRSTGREASVAFAITKYMHGYEWLSKSVTVAILAGFSSVILVMLLGQSRRSEEHTSELQSHLNLVCRLLLEKKKKIHRTYTRRYYAL